VSDTMYFDTVMGNEQTANSSASIVFGYSFFGVLYHFQVSHQIIEIWRPLKYTIFS
jgi:hypothetical protein